MSNDIDQVKKMLTALLKSQGNLHWIGGYTHGRTSNDDPFIILYPSAEHLKHKVCRVYPDQFRKLPAFIDTAVPTHATDSNPDKDKAQAKGIYRECPPFQVLTFDGKDTSMGPEKRFSDVLYVPQANSSQPAPTKQPAQQNGNGNGRKPAQDTQESEADHWRREALTAENAFMFDTAVIKFLPSFASVGTLQKFRESLFGEFRPGWNLATLTALETYIEERDGRSGREVHEAAKVEALNAYNRVGK